MEQKFTPLADALRELEWHDRLQKLDAMRQNLHSIQYFVAFIGQYSAGKSFLINNLLDREILPTGVLETTPLLTYIRYSDCERALLHYQNGTIREIGITDVSSVVQNTSSWDIDTLDYLEIFLHTELLRSGLILLDTPGINTVIERHEKLLATTLNLATKVIYVTGQAPHANDIETISTLAHHGTAMAFVRTHCDEIKASEESAEEVIKNDLELMCTCGVSEINCFHVSNVASSTWFSNIALLKKSIMHIGNHVAQELTSATEKQLQALTHDCISALEEKCQLLEAAKAGDDALCKKKLSEAERKILHFEKIISDRERKLSNDLAKCDRKIHGSVLANASDYIEDSCYRIINDDNARTATQMQALFNTEAKRILERINADINMLVNPILHGINDDLKLDSFSFNSDVFPSIDTFAELAHSQDCESEQLRAKLNYIQENRSAIETQLRQISEDPAFSSLQSDLIALEQEIMEIQSTFDSIPPYTPQMIQIEDGRMQPSQIAKMVGNIADWALLLLPSGAISGTIKTAAKSSKITAPLARVIGKSEKALSIIKNGDSVKDIAFALQNMTKTYATRNRIAKAGKLVNTVATGTEKTLRMKQTLSDSGAAPSFLDYLTIQHWAEQIGKNFDRPPKLVLDKEYEEQYQRTKSAIEKELLERQQRAYRIKCQHLAFESEQERLIAERNAAVVDEQLVSQQLNRKKSEIAKEAELQALRKWRLACGDWFKSQITSQIDVILDNYLSSLTVQLQQYQDNSIHDIRINLNAEKETFAILSDSKSIHQADIDNVHSLITTLKGL